MNAPRLFRALAAVFVFAPLVFSAPADSDPHHDHDHAPDEHDHASSDDTASFDPDHGLQLSPAANQALELTTFVVEPRPLTHQVRLTARVFDPGPPVRVTVTLPTAEASELATHRLSGAALLHTSRHLGGTSELIFSVNVPAAKSGDFITLDLVAENPAPVLSLPRSTLLETAGGHFVYVVAKEHHYRRTPVTVHAHADGDVEIVSGLSPGDRVVSSAVEQLWLTELRLTKGGGHSH